MKYNVKYNRGGVGGSGEDFVDAESRRKNTFAKNKQPVGPICVAATAAAAETRGDRCNARIVGRGGG